MLPKLERDRLRKLVSEAVVLLCKNSCDKESSKLSIEGIIGITFGEEEVVLVSFKEEGDISNGNTSNSTVPNQRFVAASDGDGETTTEPVKENTSLALNQRAGSAVSETSSTTKVPKRRRLSSTGSRNKKTCTTRVLPGNDSVSSGVKIDNLDIFPEVKTEISDDNISTIATGQDAEAFIESSDSKLPVEQPSKDNKDFKILENRQIAASELIPEKDDATSIGKLDPSISIKCEEGSAADDDDCVFIKSEIFELNSNNTLELECDDFSQGVLSDGRMINAESFFVDDCGQYSQSDYIGFEGQSQRSQSDQPFAEHSRKSRYADYVQRGCIKQASSSCGQTVQTFEDPNAQLFGSSRDDGSIECHICRTVLKCRQTLYDHIHGTHLSHYRYKCNYCGRGFKWRSMLSNHKKSCAVFYHPGFQRR